MPVDRHLKAALNSYSVAVQRYKILAGLLPPDLRPPVLERFQHRDNRWAIQRRTDHVYKLIAQMERQLGGAKPQVAPPQTSPVTSPVQAIDHHEELVPETVVPPTAEDMAQNTGGECRPTVSTPDDRYRPCTFSQDPSVSALTNTQDFRDGAAGFGNSRLPDRDYSGSASERWSNNDYSVSTLHNTDTSDDPLTPEEEIDAVVRVGIVSPDAALQMAHLVEKLKADGASPRILKEVYTTFLKYVDDGDTCADIGDGAMGIDDA
ncbi:hypothetical protein FN846DRAFT_889439 [Sphaerosporella brunnea]|uniref:Uncharacterized protein n=1 Tax=Sphaerosporella brunnea TaxID=1250544 RepID=A0A5J5F0L9_9PEZI|nr:hypothetical protein FN846DRAFT_889439 [Sphaerosporella brunnea]